MLYSYFLILFLFFSNEIPHFVIEKNYYLQIFFLDGLNAELLYWLWKITKSIKNKVNA